MNPIILYDNRFDDAAPTATDTAAGYDVLNIRDGRPYTFWKGASAGAKSIKVDCGSAKAADAMALSAHNLRTAGADVTVEYSTDDITYQVALAIRKAAVARSSSAYLSDGTLVSGGAPRHETGKFGKAIMVEADGTTNLLSDNQATVETDTTGFVSMLSAVLTRVTTKAWHGSASLQVATPGSVADEGVAAAYTTSAQGTYVGQGRVRGAGTVYLTTRVAYSDASYDQATKTIKTLDDTQWHYMVGNPVTSNGAKTVSQVIIYVRTEATAQAVTFWVDGLQIEQKAYPTSWMRPGVTRTAESSSFNPAGIITPGEGTIAQWAYVDYKIKKAGTATSQLFWHATSGNENRISLGRSNTANQWYAVTANAAGTVSQSQVADALADGWHHFAFRWNSTELCIFVDGVKGTPVASPNLPSALAALAYIGQTSNTLIDDVRIWQRSLTDVEIATEAARTTPGPADADLAGLWSFDDTVLSDLIPADTSVLRIFPEASARYWKLTVTTTTLAAQIGLASISSRLEFPYPPDIPFVPRRRKTITESSRSRNGHLLGVVMSYKEIKIKPKFSLLLRSWVDALYEPFYRDHYSLKKPFFWAWDLSLYPGMVHLVVAEGEPDDALPVSMSAYYDAVELSMEGIEE